MRDDNDEICQFFGVKDSTSQRDGWSASWLLLSGPISRMEEASIASSGNINKNTSDSSSRGSN